MIEAHPHIGNELRAHRHAFPACGARSVYFGNDNEYIDWMILGAEEFVFGHCGRRACVGVCRLKGSVLKLAIISVTSQKV